MSAFQPWFLVCNRSQRVKYNNNRFLKESFDFIPFFQSLNTLNTKLCEKVKICVPFSADVVEAPMNMCCYQHIFLTFATSLEISSTSKLSNKKLHIPLKRLATTNCSCNIRHFKLHWTLKRWHTTFFFNLGWRRDLRITPISITWKKTEWGESWGFEPHDHGLKIQWIYQTLYGKRIVRSLKVLHQWE